MATVSISAARVRSIDDRGSCVMSITAVSNSSPGFMGRGRAVSGSLASGTAVTIERHNAQKNYQPEPSVYFLVRWRPPYHFTMMDISDKPWPRCTQEDREADEWRTLFNTQEWRW